MKTHGHSKRGAWSREYTIFLGMHERCRNPNNPSWKNYGGRGIRVCEEWKDFTVFFSEMGKCPVGMSINRIDNNAGYSKQNCEWTTAKLQARNNRRSVRVLFQGKQRLVAELAEEFGVSSHLLTDRLRYGWSIEEAISTAPAIPQSNATHCKQGHPLEKVPNSKRRACKICSNARSNAYKARLKSKLACAVAVLIVNHYLWNL